MPQYLTDKELELRANYEQECKVIELELLKVEESEPDYWELQEAIKLNNKALDKAYKDYMRLLKQEQESESELC